MKPTFLLFFIVGLFMISCNQQQKKNNKMSEVDEIPEAEFAMGLDSIIMGSQNYPVEKMCFLNITKNDPIKVEDKIQQMIDSVFITVEIYEDNHVEGVFNQMPAEKDQIKGTFEGKIDGSIIDAIYTYNTEDITVKEQVIFELGEEEIIQKYGNFKQEKGTYYLKDLNNLQNLQPIGQTDCGE